MPLVRLIIFLFRGVGRIFSAIGRFLKALVGAGMRSFLVKSFEVILRLGFVGSLAAVVAVCMNLLDDKTFLDSGNYAWVGPDIWYQIGSSSYARSSKLTPAAMLRDFQPKDSAVSYRPGILTASELVDLWNRQQMRANPDQLVSWSSHSGREPKSGAWPNLREEDFIPGSWDPFRHFFEQTWAMLTLPLLLGWLVFPGAHRLRDRIHRACLMAPLCGLASFSFAYLLSRHWLSVQFEAMSEVVLELPRWTHPTGVLNKSMLVGLLLCLAPLVLWYLLRWVLGPYFGTSAAVQNP